MKIKRKCIRSKVQIRAPQFRLIIQNDLRKVGKIKQLMLIVHTHTKKCNATVFEENQKNETYERFDFCRGIT